MRKLGTMAIVILASAMLFFASCAPTATTSQATTSTVTAPPTSSVTPSATTTAVEKPKYGGVINMLQTADIGDFEEIIGWFAYTFTLRLTNEELWSGDWSKGPAGTNEADFTAHTDVWDQKAGHVAESWDLSRMAEGIINLKIRKGIHWWLNPNSEASRLVNGRELTVDDVVFTLTEHTQNPRAYMYNAAPALRQCKITAPDKSTVVIQVPVTDVPDAIFRLMEQAHIMPPEVVKKYGTMQDWRVAEGTGPFMLTDFVSNSSATFVRNANYWMKDPVGPGKGNQLPYADGVKFLIIPDASTQEAAFRTGRLDVYNAPLETARNLQQNKQLVTKTYFGDFAEPTAMRTDKPPFNDVRVRRALMMATDFEAIKRDLYGGQAQILTWPIPYVKEYKDAYLGVDDPEMPASVKELYTYNPGKAKALLAEAGYPKGFSSKVVIPSTSDWIDYYSLLVGMWAKAGVDVAIDARESGVAGNIMRARAYEGMERCAHPPIAGLFSCTAFWGTGPGNGSYVNDPYATEARGKLQKAVVEKGQKAAMKDYKELMKYVLDQAWAIPKVMGSSYAFWWPWLKNYHGESTIGYHNQGAWAYYVWIDQDLKKSMGH